MIVHIAVEPETVFADGFERDIADLYVFGKLDETVEVKAVVFGSFFGAAAFDFQEFDKIGYQIAREHTYSIYDIIEI